MTYVLADEQKAARARRREIAARLAEQEAEPVATITSPVPLTGTDFMRSLLEAFLSGEESLFGTPRTPTILAHVRGVLR